MDESRRRDAGRDSSGCGPAVPQTDAHCSGGSTQGTVVERLSKYGTRVMPSASQRRSRLQRQPVVADGSAPPRGSLTPAARQKHLKELPPGDPPPQTCGPSPAQDAGWALWSMEHTWMLSAAGGDFDFVLEFVAADPQLITRKDFISGYSVLHWLAKKGRDETLVELLGYARSAGVPVDVNVRGSGGLTPLHVASMHRQYMVVKLLVGAFGADVDAMDYNGRRAWQYLRGDAPLEMRKLLGTWDDEHATGCAQDNNKNVNNNNHPAGASGAAPCQVDEEAEVNPFDRRKRGGSWRFRSLRKLLPSVSFLGNQV